MAREPRKKTTGDQPYAERVLPDGRIIRYNTEEEYQRGKFQAAGTMAATRARIRKTLTGR